MPRTLICNLGHFISVNFPEYYELLERNCIDIKKNQACAIIPTKASIKKYAKELKDAMGGISDFLGGNDGDQIQKALAIKTLLYAHFIRDEITPDFKGKELMNGIQQLIKISDVGKKGEITILSGPKYETKAIGRLANVTGTPNYSGTNAKVSVIILESGEIAVNGNRSSGKLEGAGPEVMPIDSTVYDIKQSANEMILDICKAVGKDFYVPVVAGLLHCLEKEGPAVCKKFAHFIYPSAASTFYVLVQPHNSNGQFLPNEFIKRWMCVPCFCPNYDKQRSDFIAKYSEPGKRLEIAERLQEVPDMQNINGMFLDLYKKTYSSLFPEGFTPVEKLWADELGYRISMAMFNDPGNCEKANSLAKVVNGEKIQEQGLFSDEKFWSNMLANRNEKKSLNFFRGDWILHKGAPGEYVNPAPIPSFYKKLIQCNKDYF